MKTEQVEWITKFATLNKKNATEQDEIFLSNTKGMSAAELNQLSVFIEMHIRTLDRIRQPLAYPKIYLYILAVLGSFFLYKWLPEPVFSVVPIVIVLALAALDWVGTSKYIYGYKTLVNKLDYESSKSAV
ncbi:hypothetical protein VCRA2110O2_30080 [Vibrio crassostreae]|nr:hypothetical protein VCHA44O286_50297 [Vibrio chagasii]CAK2847049.1 hypothetical protein VCRA2110O2_30080 [Vibrio crassostreae]